MPAKIFLGTPANDDMCQKMDMSLITIKRKWHDIILDKIFS